MSGLSRVGPHLWTVSPYFEEVLNVLHAPRSGHGQNRSDLFQAGQVTNTVRVGLEYEGVSGLRVGYVGFAGG